MIFVLSAAILNFVNVILEKSIFDHQRKRYKIFVPLSFLFSLIVIVMFLVPFMIIFPSFGAIKKEAFTFVPLLFLFIVIAISSTRNMLYYSGFQREGISKIEPFVVFTPLLTVILAGIFYPDERNWIVIALSIVAAFALIFSHVEKKHLVFDKGLIPIIAAVILEAVETIFIKDLLRYYSPVAMYGIRVAFVAFVLFLFIKPNLKKVSKKEYKNLFVVGALWVAIMVSTYFGYQILGVIDTVLIFMISPVLMVLGSYLILKEKKIRTKDIVALVIVLACVVVAQVVK